MEEDRPGETTPYKYVRMTGTQTWSNYGLNDQPLNKGALPAGDELPKDSSHFALRSKQPHPGDRPGKTKELWTPACF